LPEEEEERRRSEGLGWKLQKPQGLHCKQKISHLSKALMRK
jgi:hypothetical protein